MDKGKIVEYGNPLELNLINSRYNEFSQNIKNYNN